MESVTRREAPKITLFYTSILSLIRRFKIQTGPKLKRKKNGHSLSKRPFISFFISIKDRVISGITWNSTFRVSSSKGNEAY